MSEDRKQIRDAVKAVVLHPYSILLVNGDQVATKEFIEAVEGLRFPWPTPVIFTRGGTDISLFTEDQLVAALDAIHASEEAALRTQKQVSVN